MTLFPFSLNLPPSLITATFVPTNHLIFAMFVVVVCWLFIIMYTNTRRSQTGTATDCSSQYILRIQLTYTCPDKLFSGLYLTVETLKLNPENIPKYINIFLQGLIIAWAPFADDGNDLATRTVGFFLTIIIRTRYYLPYSECRLHLL